MTELLSNLSITFQMETNDSCIHMNDMLWIVRQDLTTSPLVMAIFAICYAVIIIFGVIGNSCVILSISRTRSLQTVPNMFIFSLSCSDIVVCFTSATITPITAFKKDWIFGGFLCSVAPFIAGVSLCFSTFTLAAISIDRFMLIRYPMKKPFSHFQASVAILLNCFLATILSAPAISVQKLDTIGTYCGRFCYEDWGSHRQNLRRVYGTAVLFCQFILPLTVIMLCYTAISVRLGQSLLLKTKKRNYEWQLQVSDQQKVANKRRQRTNRMFIAMVVAFSLSWVWSVLFNLLRDYDILPAFVKDQEFFVGILTHCIAMTSTVWNPILYALLNLQLRVAFLQLMPTCLRECFCSGLAAKTLSEEGLGKRHHSTFHRSAVNGNTAHKSPSNNNNCGTTLLIANGAAIDDNFDDDVSRDSRYRSETKYGTLGFPGQGAKVEDCARQPLLSTMAPTTAMYSSPNRFRSASFTNFGADEFESAPPTTVTTERAHNLAPPVRSSSARRKESFLLRDMLSGSRIARSFRKRKPTAQSEQSPSVSGRELDGVAAERWQLLPQATLDHDEHQLEPVIGIGAGRPALLRCFLSDAHQCQSLSLDAGRGSGDYFTPGTPNSRLDTPGDRISRSRLNTTGGGSAAGDPEWLSPGDKAARVLGLHGNDPFADLDDGRAAGWWQRRKSACSCIAPVSGTTGNDLLPDGNANKWGRSVSSRRLDDGDPVPGQLLGLGGALMVPLATQRRSRSLTRSALTLLRTPIRASLAANRAVSFSNSSAFSGSDEEPLVAKSSSSSSSSSIPGSPLTGTTTANAGFFASSDDSEAEF
uniref:G_PROTEIN_RECEP_F1_2 domain-containing protein n=1 Tax=Panagrellus redivivus TaxID=6233 RepID=A0A7E4UQ63_PANRE